MKKISIVTVCYNSADTIRDTIESVLAQDYPNIEHIIIDGLSTDGTQDIVRKYLSDRTKLYSEKDKGLYDAMNKGLGLASGEIIGILNSDDIYANNKVISLVASRFESRNVGIVYGDLYYFKTGHPDKPLRYYRGGMFSLKRVSYGLVPPHPTFFIKKEVYEKHGTFDTRYTLSADFDLIIRLLGVHKIPFEYLNVVLVKMRIGGKSTSSLKRTFIMNKEDLISCKRNGIRTNIFKFYCKYLVKLLTLR